MTKKHFMAVAGELRAQLAASKTTEAERIIEDVANALALYTFPQFNPRFDRARFLAACGVAMSGSGQPLRRRP